MSQALTHILQGILLFPLKLSNTNFKDEEKPVTEIMLTNCCHILSIHATILVSDCYRFFQVD